MLNFQNFRKIQNLRQQFNRFFTSTSSRGNQLILPFKTVLLARIPAYRYLLTKSGKHEVTLTLFTVDLSRQLKILFVRMCEVDQEKIMQGFMAISLFIFDLSEDKWRGTFLPHPEGRGLMRTVKFVLRHQTGKRRKKYYRPAPSPSLLSKP